MTSIGKLIKQHRTTKGWSQAELCRRAKIASSNLSKMERTPTYRPRPETIQKIAKALDIPADDLIPAESFGQRIQKMRLAKGWTVSELAKKMRVTERAINYRESRDLPPEYTMVLAYAYIFKVKAESIYEPNEKGQQFHE